MEDREILDVIRTLAAEERRLRQQRDEGLIDGATASERQRRVSQELSDMWRVLRARRAERDDEPTAEQTLNLRSPGVVAS